MTVNLVVVRRLLFLVAAVLFLVAWFISTGTPDSWHDPAPWGYAGLFFTAVGLII